MCAIAVRRLASLMAYDCSDIGENHCGKNAIRFGPMERASDELLDLVGDDVLRIGCRVTVWSVPGISTYLAPGMCSAR